MKKRTTDKTKKEESQRGQSMVELAITLVILLMLLLGIFDFGYGFLYYITIKDAAEEGAIYGSLYPSTSCNTQLTSRVRNSSSSPAINISNPANTQVTITRTGTTSGSNITVRVDHQYHIITPFIASIIGNANLNLRAQITNTILTSSTACP
jgi:Flp pilus assembly protein TadG